MQIFITIIHVVVCFVLVLVVLLQAGKGASMGAAFGGSSQTVFGSSGPSTFLSKMTTWVAVVFMLTSLALSHPYFYSSGGGSLMKGAKQQDTKAAPQVPAQQPQAPSAPAAQGQPAPPAAPGK